MAAKPGGECVSHALIGKREQRGDDESRPEHGQRRAPQ
jgi:hypothetical protein